MLRTHRLCLLVVCTVCLGACGGGTPAPVQPGPPTGTLPAVEVFSAERAWADLEELVDLGPRPAGSAAAAEARDRIREAVEDLGVEVEEVEATVNIPDGDSLSLHHLVATLPGASEDRFVFVTPYDSGRYADIEFVGANQGASGAALLLELLRVFSSQRDLPYTLCFVWLEGEGRLGRGEGPVADIRWLGSESLARLWAKQGELGRIRLLVAFDRVCDADLHVARDLSSYRWYRDEFWKAAERLGRTDAFPPQSPFETVQASHRAFLEQGVRFVVAIADTSFGGDEPPGLYAESEDDVLEHCSAESLGTVGTVTVQAVETIARRLAKIDRFTRSPSAAPEASP